jgi:hypothetical protein
MVDPASSGESLERERLLLERERLRFERQKLAVDVLLKKRDLASPRRNAFKELLANPFALAVAGGFITIMTTIATTSYTASENRASEDRRAKQALQAELIKKFVDAPKPEIVRENLKFLVNVGFLPDYANGITNYLKDDPNAAPTTSSTALGDVGQRFETVAPALVRQLMSDFGFTDFQAAGIVGNIGFETAGLRILQEMRPLSGRGGLGYLQWSGSKRDNFEKFCLTKSLDPASAEANYGFLKQELEGPEKLVVTSVKTAATLEDATTVFEQKVVRGPIKSYPARITWARKALDLVRQSKEAAQQ